MGSDKIRAIINNFFTIIHSIPVFPGPDLIFNA